MKLNNNDLQSFEELPQGWVVTTLGKILPLTYGKALKKEIRNESGNVPVYGSSGQVGVHSNALTNKPALVVGRKGSVGEVYRSPVPCWPIDTVYFAEERDDSDLKYIEYLLKGLKLSKLDKSTAVPGLSRDDYNAVEVAIAPLDQQKRIVTEIEKQFSRLDEAVANLKRVKANLKRYKAAVLKAAVEGRLVTVGAKMGKSEWKRRPISVAVESLDQGWSPKCENEPAQKDDDWAVMKTTAVQSLQYLDTENKRLPDELEPRTHLELTPGDLLITRAGPRSRVGVACLVRATRPRVMLCDKVYRLRAKQNVALPAYLELVLNSPDVVEAINELKTGISDSGVNLTQTRFKNLLVPIPSVVEQEHVLTEVDRRLSLLRETEAQVDANLQRAERLRQSILKIAFSEELVISRE